MILRMIRGSVEDALAEYVERLEQAGRHETARQYRRYLRRWLDALADPQYPTEPEVHSFTYEHGKTAATSVVRLAAIRGFVGFLVETERLSVKDAARLVKGWRV